MTGTTGVRAPDPVAARLQMMATPRRPGIDLGLGPMMQALARLGDPQKHLPPVIHVAGTNGKGSTLAACAAALTADDRKVHWFRSPAIRRDADQILLTGETMADADLLAALAEVERDLAGGVPLTAFEWLTLTAFRLFAAHPADAVLLETGLGGRDDCTNVVPQPAVVGLTPIGLDHMGMLGADLRRIAAAKAGIMRPGVPAVSAAQRPAAACVLRQEAARVGCPFSLRPAFAPWAPFSAVAVDLAWRLLLQARPAVGAVSSAALAALDTITLLGRHQDLSAQARAAGWIEADQRLIFDGAHNADAAARLAVRLADTTQPPRALIFGAYRDKDAAGMLAPLLPLFDAVAVVALPGLRPSHDSGSLGEILRGFPTVTTAHDAQSAILGLSRASPRNTSLILAGSLSFGGEVAPISPLSGAKR